MNIWVSEEIKLPERKITALITGVNGFIGSHLAEKLISLNCKVIGFDFVPMSKAENIEKIKKNKKFFYVEGDIRSTSDLNKLFNSAVNLDIVIHLASVVGVEKYLNDPEKIIEVSFEGTKNIIDLCKKKKIRLLFSSTSEIFGKNPKLPWSNNHDRVLGPTHVNRWVYSTAKALSEHLLFALHKKNKINMTIVRFFNVYGPRQSTIFLVSKSINMVLNDIQPILFGNGLETRCFTYIDDVTDALILAATKKDAIGCAFNIGNTNEISNNKVIKLILEICNKKKLGVKKIQPKNFYGNDFEDIPRRVPNIELTKKILNWEAKTSVHEGLIQTVDWYKKNLNNMPN